MDAIDTERWDAFVVEAARLVLDDERAVDRIHAQHVRGRGGDCTSCGRGAAWPCVHLAIAHRVTWLRGESG